MTRKRTRRDFLRDSTLAGVGFWVAGASTGANAKGPNDKISFAGVGVGGKGHSDIVQAGNLGPVVAICDIDEQRLDKAEADLKKAGHTPKRFFDYRKMLEEMGSQIDAVTVSTPDHTHAPAAAMAIKMKKHVYVQKPLTHSVYEARRLRELAREHKVCTQMGNQGTASDGLRRGAELIQAGILGTLKEAHIWTNRPVWDQAPTYMTRPKDTPTVPKHVHWDLFLGPAMERPYHSCYHPFGWRGWWDFGTGALGDMACHTANTIFMGCKLGYPTSASAEAGDLNPESCPTWARVALEFSQPALKWYWYEGREGGRHNKDGKRILPPDELLARCYKGQQAPGSGSFLVGEKGIMVLTGDQGEGHYFVGDNAEELKAAAAKVPTSLPRNNKGDQGMKNEWVDAMRQNKPAIALSNFDYAGMLTEAVLLGNVAMRAGKKFEWNGPEMKAVDCPAAAQYIKREYRRGWEV